MKQTATQKGNLLVLTTRNPYTANEYEDIFRYALGSKFTMMTRKREYTSHEGENDVRTYYRFQARVTESEEAYIREQVRMMQYPTYFANKGGND